MPDLVSGHFVLRGSEKVSQRPRSEKMQSFCSCSPCRETSPLQANSLPPVRLQHSCGADRKYTQQRDAKLHQNPLSGQLLTYKYANQGDVSLDALPPRWCTCSPPCASQRAQRGINSGVNFANFAKIQYICSCPLQRAPNCPTCQVDVSPNATCNARSLLSSPT